jgi:hypothetical protein
MKPNISEFSYGYALTDEIVHSNGSSIIGAPVFPSLYAEGQAGGGWDVKLNRPAAPLFLQFKLSEYMSSRACREHRSRRLQAPCYRMHLRPKRHSDQHALLLALEEKGYEVYYSAPAFHQPRELDDAFANKQVRSRSVWVRPAAIGPLPDDKDHHVSFQHPGRCFFFSEPRQLEASSDYESVSTTIQSRLAQDRERLSDPEFLETVASDLSAAIAECAQYGDRYRPAMLADRRPGHSVRRASYLAATFLDCQMFMMWSRI